MREWYHGGPTTLDNLALLCGHHHHLLHNSDWTLRITDGQPQFTPHQHPPPAQPRAA